MNHRFITIALLAFFLLGYLSVLPFYEASRKAIKKEEVKGITLPPAIIKLFALEYRSIAADFLFVRLSQFYGGKVETIEKATKDDWQWLHRNLDLVTELDPYFQDPYFMANGFLTWDAGMYEEAEMLLQKAVKARTWDWTFPFFIGFNRFFFMGDNKGGADYLLMAYERPGAWNLLPSLAARLYYEDKKTETAISFLEKIWERESDVNIKKYYRVRLDALNKILFLEKAVDFYTEKIGLPPASLKALVDSKIIRGIPPDPYGGMFYIDKEGKVKSTSKLARKPK
ncbi:MAG: hypothetical protein OEV42_00115 [Deltaproteobacteria bacterium]|nr:hypothetical protein [Deltaproteobacteria bacterium]